MRLYPKQLEEYIRSTHFIPRLLRYDEILKENKKYFDIYNNESFRVLDKYYIGHDIYYMIEASKGRQHNIPDPIRSKTIYQLYSYRNNYKNINIINDGKFYFGYEIIYWFYINKIDLESQKYRKFSSYLEYSGLSCISMNKKYKVAAKFDKEYYSIRFIGLKDKRREWRI